jgi:hypothetical protein
MWKYTAQSNVEMLYPTVHRNRINMAREFNITQSRHKTSWPGRIAFDTSHCQRDDRTYFETRGTYIVSCLVRDNNSICFVAMKGQRRYFTKFAIMKKSEYKYSVFTWTKDKFKIKIYTHYS